jgi:hypothetical protein
MISHKGTRRNTESPATSYGTEQFLWDGLAISQVKWAVGIRDGTTTVFYPSRASMEIVKPPPHGDCCFQGDGASGWIRTTVVETSGLLPDPFVHSGTDARSTLPRFQHVDGASIIEPHPSSEYSTDPQGGISPTAPRALGCTLPSLPPILHRGHAAAASSMARAWRDSNPQRPDP